MAHLLPDHPLPLLPPLEAPPLPALPAISLPNLDRSLLPLLRETSEWFLSLTLDLVSSLFGVPDLSKSFQLYIGRGENFLIVNFSYSTVTESSAGAICNATSAAGAFKSGKQDVGFKYPVTGLDTSAPTFYFC